jgi:hypothetical protein
VSRTAAIPPGARFLSIRPDALLASARPLLGGSTGGNDQPGARVRRRIPATATLVLAAIALVASGCATSPRPPTRSELLRGVLPSAVQLLAERSGGGRRAASGVVLASDSGRACTWVLTAGHFVAPPVPESIYVRTAGARERFRATVVRADGEADLALLLVPGLVLPPVRRREVAHLGDDVWVVAFPRGRQMTLVSGTVSQPTSRAAASGGRATAPAGRGRGEREAGTRTVDGWPRSTPPRTVDPPRGDVKGGSAAGAMAA